MQGEWALSRAALYLNNSTLPAAVTGHQVESTTGLGLEACAMTRDCAKHVSNLVFPTINSITVRCSRATTASRLVADTSMSPKIPFLVWEPNCGCGDEGCGKNVKFGPSA
jgi:hypothetical protein